MASAAVSAARLSSAVPTCRVDGHATGQAYRDRAAAGHRDRHNQPGRGKTWSLGVGLRSRGGYPVLARGRAAPLAAGAAPSASHVRCSAWGRCSRQAGGRGGCARDDRAPRGRRAGRSASSPRWTCRWRPTGSRSPWPTCRSHGGRRSTSASLPAGASRTCTPRTATASG